LSSSSGGFNQFHNVFGPFQVVKFATATTTDPAGPVYPASILKAFAVG